MSEGFGRGLAEHFDGVECWTRNDYILFRFVKGKKVKEILIPRKAVTENG